MNNKELWNNAPREDATHAPPRKVNESPRQKLNTFFESQANNTTTNGKTLDRDDTTLVTADETETTEEPERIELKTVAPFEPVLERIHGLRIRDKEEAKTSARVPEITWQRRRLHKFDSLKILKVSNHDTTPVFTWRRQKIRHEPTRIDDDKKEEKEEANKSSPAAVWTLKTLQKHRILGEGQFGQVWLVSHQDDNHQQPMALKIQSKYELALEDKIDFAVREKNILQQMDHPFIIHLRGSFQDDHFLYMLLDLVQGGELWSLLHPQETNSNNNNNDHPAETTTTVRLPEDQARFYAHCLADALRYMHETHHVVYRDIKPENVLVDATGYPVLIDFGLAKRLAPGELTHTMVGTPSYCSPEVVMTQGHGMQADNWALGILVYEMLAGCNPFFYEGLDQMSLFHSIAQDDYPEVPNVSEEATDFIWCLLVKDPTERMTSADALQHAWLTKNGQDDDLSSLRARTATPPWIPNVSSPLDTSYFDDWSDLEDKSQQKYPLVEPRDAALFQGF